MRYGHPTSLGTPRQRSAATTTDPASPSSVCDTCSGISNRGAASSDCFTASHLYGAGTAMSTPSAPGMVGGSTSLGSRRPLRVHRKVTDTRPCRPTPLLTALTSLRVASMSRCSTMPAPSAPASRTTSRHGAVACSRDSTTANAAGVATSAAVTTVSACPATGGNSRARSPVAACAARVARFAAAARPTSFQCDTSHLQQVRTSILGSPKHAPPTSRPSHTASTVAASRDAVLAARPGCLLTTATSTPATSRSHSSVGTTRSTASLRHSPSLSQSTPPVDAAAVAAPAAAAAAPVAAPAAAPAAGGEISSCARGAALPSSGSQ